MGLRQRERKVFVAKQMSELYCRTRITKVITNTQTTSLEKQLRLTVRNYYRSHISEKQLEERSYARLGSRTVSNKKNTLIYSIT